jgi:sugar transferase EpsL
MPWRPKAYACIVVAEPEGAGPVVAAGWLRSPVRRAVEVVAVGLVTAALAPVLLVVAVLVRVRLGSPVIFRQQRAGLGGRPFAVWKFRTMTDATGPDGELLPDDERLTAFGRGLRASSLDELPQLLTVLRGQMSVIGPRPLPLQYVDRYSPAQRARLLARPGLTGWSQVQGRNAIDWPTKLAHDVWYVEHASLAVDVRIVFATLAALVRRDGVSAAGHATMPEFMGET